MSATLTRQSHLYAFSGTTCTADGDGMATMLAHDLHYALNNLGAYVDLRITSPQAPNTGAAPVGGYKEINLHTASREIYIVQTPIILAKNATRFVWTAGVEAYSAGPSAPTVTLSAVSVYLSAVPYTGAETPTAFDLTKLSPSYLKRSVAVAVSQVGEGRTYALADDSATGITAPAMPPTVAVRGSDYLGYLILTATGLRSTAVEGDSGAVRLYDFTSWNPYE